MFNSVCYLAYSSDRVDTTGVNYAAGVGGDSFSYNVAAAFALGVSWLAYYILSA